MKKTIVLLLAFSIAAMLCACAGTEEPKQSDTAAEQTGIQTEAPAETPAGEDNLLTVVQRILGDGISFDDYEIFSQDEEMVTLYLLDDQRIELDYTISLDDGTTVQLPMVYGDLLDAGWTSNIQWPEQIDGNSMGFVAHTNEEGRTIYVSVINPTDEAVDPEDAWINSVTVGGDYTEGFDIRGIHAGSTIADIVAAWGSPYSISYYADGDYEKLDLLFEATDYGALTMHIDTQTGLVSSVTYHFPSNQIG